MEPHGKSIFQSQGWKSLYAFQSTERPPRLMEHFPNTGIFGGTALASPWDSHLQADGLVLSTFPRGLTQWGERREGFS